jgi:site-specific recombinase XerD
MPRTENRALLPDRVDEYLNYLLNVKGSGALTVESYARDLRLFFDFLAEKKPPLSPPETAGDLRWIDDGVLAAVSLRDVYNFLTYCGQTRGNNVTTRRRKSSALRGFFKYISDNMGYIDHNPTANLELAGTKTKLPRYLTLEQSVQLLQAVEGDNATRDRCILTLFLNCGLRLAELC